MSENFFSMWVKQAVAFPRIFPHLLGCPDPQHAAVRALRIYTLREIGDQFIW
jgi:hypothetical protein